MADKKDFIVRSGLTVSTNATINTAVIVGNSSVNAVINSTTFSGTANNASYLNGNTASDLQTYADNKASNAYSNATSYADTKAGTAYSNATSYADSKAANAYSNATSYADTVSGTAYSNAVTYANSTFAKLSGATFTGNVVTQANLTTNSVFVNGSLQIDGDLTVGGNVVTINTQTLNVEDNMIYLNANSATANPDLGFAGNYNDGTYRHAGFFRDATDGVWKVFDQYLPEPDTSPFIDTANASFRIADFQANSLTVANLTTTTNTVTIGNSAYFAANGYVGIGTNTPTMKLHVSDPVGNGNLFYISAPGGENPNFVMQGSGEQTFRFFNNAASGSTRVSWKMADRANTDWRWIMYTDVAGNGDESFTIDGRVTGQILRAYSGNVSLAAAATGSGNTKNVFIATGGAAGSQTNITVGTSLANTLLTVNANNATFSGSIGIGTTSPGYRLEANGYIYSRFSDGSLARIGLQNSNRHWSISNYGTAFAPNGLFAVADETAGLVRFSIDTSGNIGIGTTSSTDKLTISNPSLGITAGDIKTGLQLTTTSGNVDSLNFFKLRNSNGSNWQTAGWRLQAKVDSFWHGYIQFNGNNNEGISFGTGASNVGANSIQERMRIDNAGRVAFSASGTTSFINVWSNKTLTGSTTFYGIQSDGVVQSDVTADIALFRSNLQTAAASFTLGAAYGFAATSATLGAGSTVTLHAGFYAGASLTSATNNAGFFSNVPSGSGRWNFYAQGTADNYFAGNVGIGTSTPATKLEITGTIQIKSGTNAYNQFVVGASNTSSGYIATINSSGTRVGFSNWWDGGAYYAAWTDGTIPVQIGTNGLTRIFIDGSGNIGIGNTAPTHKLMVNGNLNANGHAFIGLGTSAISTTTTSQLHLNGDFSIYGTNRSIMGNIYYENGWKYGANGFAWGFREDGSGKLQMISAPNNTGGYANAASVSLTDLFTFDLSTGRVGLGTASPAVKLAVNGAFSATTKSFVIDHPSKPGMKLRYGSLEGPENGVYVRGKLNSENVIVLPDYWVNLVDKETITVNLTPYGSKQDLCVMSVLNNTVYINEVANCYFTVFAERKDVDKLIVEYEETENE